MNSENIIKNDFSGVLFQGLLTFSLSWTYQMPCLSQLFYVSNAFFSQWGRAELVLDLLEGVVLWVQAIVKVIKCLFQVNEDGKSVCGICSKVFSKSSQLRLHVNIHYFERPFRCDSCAVSFRLIFFQLPYPYLYIYIYGFPYFKPPFRCDSCAVSCRLVFIILFTLYIYNVYIVFSLLWTTTLSKYASTSARL